MTDRVAEIEGTINVETPDAYLLDMGDDEIWIPKSVVVEKEEGPTRFATLQVKEWFAIEKGLV